VSSLINPHQNLRPLRFSFFKTHVSRHCDLRTACTRGGGCRGEAISCGSSQWLLGFYQFTLRNSKARDQKWRQLCCIIPLRTNDCWSQMKDLPLNDPALNPFGCQI